MKCISSVLAGGQYDLKKTGTAAVYIAEFMNRCFACACLKSTEVTFAQVQYQCSLWFYFPDKKSNCFQASCRMARFGVRSA